MIVLKYLLEFFGFAMFGAAALLVAMDLVKLYRRPQLEISIVDLEWRLPARVALVGLIPVLLGLSIAVVPAGMAGVRVSQISGTLPETLYPGLHLVFPLVQSVETYDLRDQIYETTLVPDTKKGEVLKVQTKEGLELALAVTVRFRLDPRRLAYVHANLPQPVEKELVPPVVATAFRDLTPRYLVRELFATKRDEIREEAATTIAQKLAPDAVIVKEVMLRDIQLPSEYAKGLEGVLLKEQENEKLGVELDVKQKEVREAELEAEAQEARDVKAAEAQAQVTVLQAKAQSDAMQYTLPLKQKQIEQTRLESAGTEGSDGAAGRSAGAGQSDRWQGRVGAAQADERSRSRSRAVAVEGRRRQDAPGRRGAEGVSHADSEDHCREIIGQSADHDGAERREILLRKRCAEGRDAGRRGCGPAEPVRGQSGSH
jgi:regulator of protease activity HflC (stomatin/prohibitin superfamily)